MVNSNNNNGMHTVTMDIIDNKWEPITISYMWKIDLWYLGSTGIVINIQGFDSSLIYKFYVAFLFEDNGNGGDNIYAIVQFNDDQIIHRSSAKDWIFDGSNGADGAWGNFNEMRIELNEAAQLSATINYGVNEYDMIINADISSYIPSNSRYFIQSVGLQNVNMPVTAKYFYINGKYNTLAPIPTPTPTQSPTSFPTASPSDFPTKHPTTTSPTSDPTQYPSQNPTEMPSLDPTATPSDLPIVSPTAMPSESPIATSYPSLNPSAYPTNAPSLDPTNS